MAGCRTWGAEKLIFLLTVALARGADQQQIACNVEVAALLQQVDFLAGDSGIHVSGEDGARIHQAWKESLTWLAAQAVMDGTRIQWDLSGLADPVAVRGGIESLFLSAYKQTARKSYGQMLAFMFEDIWKSRRSFVYQEEEILAWSSDAHGGVYALSKDAGMAGVGDRLLALSAVSSDPRIYQCLTGLARFLLYCGREDIRDQGGEGRPVHYWIWWDDVVLDDTGRVVNKRNRVADTWRAAMDVVAFLLDVQGYLEARLRPPDAHNPEARVVRLRRLSDDCARAAMGGLDWTMKHQPLHKGSDNLGRMLRDAAVFARGYACSEHARYALYVLKVHAMLREKAVHAGDLIRWRISPADDEKEMVAHTARVLAVYGALYRVATDRRVEENLLAPYAKEFMRMHEGACGYLAAKLHDGAALLDRRTRTCAARALLTPFPGRRSDRVTTAVLNTAVHLAGEAIHAPDGWYWP